MKGENDERWMDLVSQQVLTYLKQKLRSLDVEPRIRRLCQTEEGRLRLKRVILDCMDQIGLPILQLIESEETSAHVGFHPANNHAKRAHGNAETEENTGLEKLDRNRSRSQSGGEEEDEDEKEDEDEHEDEGEDINEEKPTAATTTSTRTPLPRKRVQLCNKESDTGWETHSTERNQPPCAEVEAPKENSRAKRKRAQPPLQDTSLTAQRERFLRIDPLCKLDVVTDEAPVAVWPFLAALRSRLVVHEFCTKLVGETRSPGEAAQQPPLTEKEYRSITGACQSEGSGDLVLLAKLLVRISYFDQKNRIRQYHLGQVHTKLRRGGSRIHSEDMDRLVRLTGLSKVRLYEETRQAARWLRICGPKFDGLLCFMPATRRNGFEVSTPQYDSILSDRELREMHTALDDDYTRALCKAGQAFQESLLSQREVVFAWERNQVAAPWLLPEEEMLAQIQPCQEYLRNSYDRADWPMLSSQQQNPSQVPPEHREQACEYCTAPQPCICYRTIPTQAIRLVRFAEETRLRLLAHSLSGTQLIFKQGQTLGFLTGRIVPAEVQLAPHELEIPPGPQACQLDVSQQGNWFAMMGGACAAHTTARLQWRAVAGEYMCAVDAKRNIVHGTEITVQKTAQQPTVCVQCSQDPQDMRGEQESSKGMLIPRKRAGVVGDYPNNTL